MNGDTLCIALGGNAIQTRQQTGTIQQQIENITKTAQQLVQVIPHYKLVITHGNGPQVGNLLIQQEAGLTRNIPQLPLDVCGAMTQGQIGYLLQNILEKLANPPIKVCTVITQVVVDEQDSAFQNPTKPIGPFYTEDEMEKIQSSQPEYSFIEDAGRGYRRVVPSPIPIEIHERDQIRSLLENGFIVIAAGGGGIPVVKTNDFSGVRGVEAVIDKDLAGVQLALDTQADILAFLTDTDYLYTGYDTAEQKPVHRLTLTDLEESLAKGIFGDKLKGSMGPKLAASAQFLRRGGKKVIITRPEFITVALEGKYGTLIIA